MKPCGPSTTSLSAASSLPYVSVQAAGAGLGVVEGEATVAGVDVGPGGEPVGVAVGDGVPVDPGEQAAINETTRATVDVRRKEPLRWRRGRLDHPRA